ncbi:Gfo/Idh/MocA family oxidoreductase [bacterium]|nr:Gfo/Idh/MocA family oxidoreductase [bacterium]
MNEIRIGLVGLGHRAVGSWIPILTNLEGVRITAVCDWIEPLHERALAEIPYRQDVKTFTEYEDLLAWNGIDAVGLCVRRLDQGALAAQALEAGKHVQAEVPAAHRLEDCWRIVLAAERSGNLYHLAEQVRFAGFIEAWKKLVRDGRLGRIVYAEGEYIGYYGTRAFFQDFATGQQYAVEELADHPQAQPTMLHTLQPIEYLPHELSPLLKILDDRVVQVVGMGTRAPSYHHPEIAQPDIQAALMKTEKDTVLRLACGFAVPVPHGLHHWYRLHGTNGRVEWQRSLQEKPKLWLADGQMEQPAAVDWRWERTDASEEANRSGHGGTDWHAHASFRDALLHGKAPELDVYRAMETAAPAILAAESIRQGSVPLPVPDFRPGPHRRPGEAPQEKG